MGYSRTRRSPVATTSNPSASALTALPSPSVCLAIPSTQLGPSRSEVSMRVKCLMTQTLRPSRRVQLGRIVHRERHQP